MMERQKSQPQRVAASATADLDSIVDVFLQNGNSLKDERWLVAGAHYCRLKDDIDFDLLKSPVVLPPNLLLCRDPNRIFDLRTGAMIVGPDATIVFGSDSAVLVNNIASRAKRKWFNRAWKDLPGTDGIPDPIAYLYYGRLMIGLHANAGLWWTDNEEISHYRCVKASAAIVLPQPIILAERDLPPDELGALLEDCATAGVFSISDIVTREYLGVNFDTLIAIKYHGMTHSYHVTAGGTSERHRAVLAVLRDHCPDLWPPRVQD